MRRHQPRLMLLVAGSLMVEKPRSAAGAAGVGAAVRRRGVVVFLPGLRRDVRPDGEGLLGAAGRRVLRRGEDLRPGAVEGHGVRAERAAEFARGGGAGDAVVAVGVVGGEPAELVPGEFSGLLVVRGDLVCGGGGGQRAQVQQWLRGGGAVEVAVGDDRAVRRCPGGRGRAGAGPGRAGRRRRAAGGPRRRRRGGRSRSRPGCRPAGMPSAGMRVSTGVKARTGSAWQDDRVIRRVSSGTGGPSSSRVMVAAEW